MPTIAGSCLCGAVRYVSSAQPAFTVFCHCRDCQKAGGGGDSSVLRAVWVALIYGGGCRPGDDVPQGQHAGRSLMDRGHPTYLV